MKSDTSMTYRVAGMARIEVLEITAGNLALMCGGVGVEEGQGGRELGHMRVLGRRHERVQGVKSVSRRGGVEERKLFASNSMPPTVSHPTTPSMEPARGERIFKALLQE